MTVPSVNTQKLGSYFPDACGRMRAVRVRIVSLETQRRSQSPCLIRMAQRCVHMAVFQWLFMIFDQGELHTTAHDGFFS